VHSGLLSDTKRLEGLAERHAVEDLREFCQVIDSHNELTDALGGGHLAQKGNPLAREILRVLLDVLLLAKEEQVALRWDSSRRLHVLPFTKSTSESESSPTASST
jgi:hypothetical protein